jgi:hypothetical protein
MGTPNLRAEKWNDNLTYSGGTIDYLLARPDTGEVRISGGGLHEWKQKFRAGGFNNGPNGIPENGGGDDIFLGVLLSGVTWSTVVPPEVGNIGSSNGWFFSGQQTGEGDVTASYPGATPVTVFVRVYPPDWQPGNSKPDDGGGDKYTVGQTTLQSNESLSTDLRIQNFPNPFNPSTTFAYRVPEGETGRVSLEIYSLRGRRIATLVDGVQAPGEYQVQWNGVDSRGEKVSSGMYLYRFQVDREMIIRKMTIIK